MRKLTMVAVLAWGLFSAPAWALVINSIAPTTVSTGTAVTLTGGPFTSTTRVIIGDFEITPRLVGERQLVFTVPSLPEGEYALFLQDGQQTSQQTYNLRVVEPTPTITSMTPTNIDTCSSADERRVTVEAGNVLPGASLLLDGAAVAYSRSGRGSLTFTPPALEGGIYPVQVVNPGGTASLPHSLWFNNIPEIISVQRGEEFVNSYQLVITGKNFFYNSTLVVNEYPVGFSDLPPQQRIVIGQGAQYGPFGNPGRGQSDNVYYVDCTTLIYNRYPYTTQDKAVSLQVINPDGKKTVPFQTFIP